MNRIIIITALAFILASCAMLKKSDVKENQEITTASGLKYTVYEHNTNAPKVDTGDVVTVHYLGTLQDSTKFDSSFDRKLPFTVEVGAGKVIKGWDEGLTYLHKGDSALLVIPADIAYGDRKMGSIPANSTLNFIVKIVDIKKAIKPWTVNQKDRVFLEDSLSYIIVEQGSGESVKTNDKVSMQYSGYFTDLKKFDSSHDSGKPFEVILGRGRVIKGWDNGIVGMKIGEKRRLYIPYQLAYGENGRQPIPPKTDLIFDVELVKFEKLSYPNFVNGSTDTVTMDNGVKYIIGTKTNGAKIKPHDIVSFAYVGRFTNGNIFDASYDRNDSLTIEVASQKVIKGLDYGLLELKVGEKARFFIPYDLAYGEQGREPIIPAKSDLIFDVHILSKKDADVKLN